MWGAVHVYVEMCVHVCVTRAHIFMYMHVVEDVISDYTPESLSRGPDLLMLAILSFLNKNVCVCV